jgi:hypothetical protein
MCGPWPAPMMVIMDTTTQHLPQQRAGSTPYEQGTCGSPLVHAARKTLQGHKAVCDGARIETFVSGRFDGAAAGVCPACAEAVVGVR